MVWVIAFGELFFGGLWCVVWGYGGMRTHFSLLNPRRAGASDRFQVADFSDAILRSIANWGVPSSV